MFGSSFIGGLIFLIVSVAATVMFFLQGFVAQIALVFIAGIGIANPDDRGGNIAACIIALVTVVGMIVAAILLIPAL